MSRLRRFLRIWLGFSSTEANGFIILLPLLLLIVFSEPAYRRWRQAQPVDFSSEEKVLDSLVALLNKSETTPNEITQPNVASLHRFDPNKVSVAELRALGFSDRLSTRIANYRTKGGVFRVKADLGKIYGLDSPFYHKLYDYIALPETLAKTETVKAQRSVDPYQQKIKTKIQIDLNAADTSELKKVRGIGAVLAARIVKFRERLGGFVNATQLYEVYGLDSTTVQLLQEQAFVTPDFAPNRININLADEKLLMTHPYISRPLAKAIVSFRYQHGDFLTVDDIFKISIVTEASGKKLIPYLTVKE